VRVSPHSRVWVGVIPLKGRRGNGFPRDPGEAQGLRIGYKFMKIQWSPNSRWTASLYLNTSFSIFLMAKRSSKAIRATVSMKIALSDPILALVNNYVKALPFTLFWLKENVEKPKWKGSIRENSRGVVHEAKKGIQSTFKGCWGLLPWCNLNIQGLV